MKILLTQPLFGVDKIFGPFKAGANTNTFLFGQASLAAAVRGAGHDIRVIDPYHDKMTPSAYKSYIKEEKFDVIGCTIFTLTFRLAKELFEYSREVLPNAWLMAGGPHPTSMPKETLEQIHPLDIVVSGEGEITFVELLDQLKNGGNFSTIKGIAYRTTSNNTIVVNPPREFIKDLDTLPMPAYELYPMLDYVPTPNVVKRYPTIPLQVTRGCPHNCSFCQFNLALGKQYRHRSPAKIVEELLYLKKTYQARGIIFRDSTLTVNIDFLKNLCNALIDANVDLSWMCYSRTDMIAKHHKELLPLMKKAGCWQIGYGCESANQKSLDMLRKNTTVQDNITAVTETMKAGIMCSTTWILCLPGETKEDALKTLRLANKLASHVAKFFLPVPFPNTDFENICRENGGLKENVPYDEYDLVLPKSLIYVNPLIGEQDMLKMLKASYWKYYTNPRVLLKNLVMIKDRDTIKKYWSYLRMIT
jgi:anaerobic magnesium-protoporphyrin IX monomethyl ester cyclase